MKKYILPAVFLAISTLCSAAALSDSLLHRYAAEMLIVGFRGDSVETDPDIKHILSDVRPGGIILFDVDLTSGGGLGTRNIKSREQLAHLTAEMKRLADYPLIIAADQEGGARPAPQTALRLLASARGILSRHDRKQRRLDPHLRRADGARARRGRR